MDELKATRKRRQFYWAGLIEDLDDDAWGNPANYDHQRWEDEERLADKKFEDLAGQIKLAEMGYPFMAEEGPGQSSSTSAAWGSDQGHTADAHHDIHTSDKQSSIRMQHPRPHRTSPLHHPGGGGRLKYNGRDSNPNAPPRKELFWTQQKRVSAVNVWMDQMGMKTSRQTSSMDQVDIAGGPFSLGEHVATNNQNIQQDDDLYDLPVFDNSDEHHAVTEHRGNMAQPHWTALDEMAFEEAEREREEERLLLSQYSEEDQKPRDTVVRNPRNALPSSRTATLVDQSERGLPREPSSSPPLAPDLMTALYTRLLKAHVGSPDQVHVNAPASSRQEPNASIEMLGLTSTLVSDQHVSTSQQHQNSTLPPASDLDFTTASDISRKPTIGLISSAVLEPLSPPKKEREDPTRMELSTVPIELEDDPIERIDMHNDISSDEDETDLHRGRSSEGNDDDGFIHLEDTPRASSLNTLNSSSPISTNYASTTKPPPSIHLKQPRQTFSPLGLHYRDALKVDEMFSTTGTLLPPEPGSVAARLRHLRGSYEGYSGFIRRWAAARRDEDEIEPKVVLEGISNLVDARIWLVDWRERLVM